MSRLKINLSGTYSANRVLNFFKLKNYLNVFRFNLFLYPIGWNGTVACRFIERCNLLNLDYYFSFKNLDCSRKIFGQSFVLLSSNNLNSLLDFLDVADDFNLTFYLFCVDNNLIDFCIFDKYANFYSDKVNLAFIFKFFFFVIFNMLNFFLFFVFIILKFLALVVFNIFFSLNFLLNNLGKSFSKIV